MNPDNSGTLWMPPQNSTIAADIDFMYYYIYWVCVFFFFLITGIILYFCVKYRRKGKAGLTPGITHNLKLEIAWYTIPTLFMMTWFWFGFVDFMKMQVVPAGAMEVRVTAQRWLWSFDYGNGVNVQKDLFVPVNKPVKLLLSSNDVLHSFFVPNFRVKADVLPNRYQVAWFEATSEGVYQLYCAEYCGTQHSGMLGSVTVVSQEAFDIWTEENQKFGEGLTPVEYGEILFEQKQCGTCHTVDGTELQGPSFKGIFGKTEQFTDGTSGVVDENYIRESILDPGVKVVAGYQNVMTTFQGLMNDQQIDAMIAYIKSLQ